MKRIILVALGLMTMLTLQPAAAQDLRTQMRTWFERDVYPSLKAWHQEYDASLSATDLATLNTYRADAKRLMDAMRSDIKALKGTVNKGDRDDVRSKIQALREKHHDAMESIVEGVKPIAKRSKDKLRSIFDKNEDQIEAWRDQAREMLKSKQGNGSHGKGLPILGEDGKRGALKFILWDGSMPPAEEAMMDNDMMGERATQGRSTLGPMTISPAPSGNAANVRVSSVPDGAATLEIFDMNGTRVRSIPVTASNGTIDQRVDLSGLAAGTYMASVNTPQGRRTGQIVVSQ
ncbi:MAG: T9SS type A sorting domain-containing protein [Candidatus Kapabacteria bacterium]|nr:T9SS type A sorting domain-containing protein [Candidatus Kapabacteria bacterium]